MRIYMCVCVRCIRSRHVAGYDCSIRNVNDIIIVIHLRNEEMMISVFLLKFIRIYPILRFLRMDRM